MFLCMKSRKERCKDDVDCGAFPEVDFPEVDFPEVDFPEVDFPEVDFPEVDFPEVDFPEVDFSEVDFPEVDFPEVDYLILIKNLGEERLIRPTSIFVLAKKSPF